MLKVKVGKTEPVESAMKRLLKKSQRAGVIAETKRRRTFESKRTRNMRRKKTTIRKARKKAGLPV